MTREELKAHCKRQIEGREMWAKHRGEEPSGKVYEEHKLILELLEQEPCDKYIKEIDHLRKYISKLEIQIVEQQPCEDIAKAFQLGLAFGFGEKHDEMDKVIDEIKKVITPQQKTGLCKNCKYFEYNSVAKVDGIPLIVAHEICSKWGNRCKTSEDGYCFLFEPKESEG